MSGYIGTQPVPQATQTRQTFTATASQTSFATAGYTPNYLDVWLNGVKLVNGTDFTATNGSDVVLTSGAADGDTLEVLAFTSFEVLNQSFTGTTTVDVLNVTGAATGTDLTLSGGVYLGGTGSANLLDDYEEGTWTPTWSVGGTITVNNATYVKVGTLCTLFFDLVFPAASDTNTAYTSIPFTFSLSSYASGTLVYTNNSSLKPMECQVSSPGLAFRTNQLSTISYANMAGYRVIGSVAYKTT